jgi:hypothetical protein
MDDKLPLRYFSLAPLSAEPSTLQSGEGLKVNYRILVHPGRGGKDQLEEEWTAFSESRE